MRLGSISSSTWTISTGAPQGCVLSPLLFSFYMCSCTTGNSSVKLLKFVDDTTTVICLIQDGDESAYRREMEQLALWCCQNNLEPNTLRVVDFRGSPLTLPPITILNNNVSAVESFMFL